jgi:hypothetical protein
LVLSLGPLEWDHLGEEVVCQLEEEDLQEEEEEDPQLEGVPQEEAHLEVVVL